MPLANIHFNTVHMFEDKNRCMVDPKYANLKNESVWVDFVPGILRCGEAGGSHHSLKARVQNKAKCKIVLNI